MNALRYFKNLVLWDDLGSFFKNNMSQLMESLIIPNLGVTPFEKLQFDVSFKLPSAAKDLGHTIL